MDILEVRNVGKTFPVRKNLFGRPTLELHAVRSVSFSVPRGSVFSIVGESGSGKSTVGNLVAGVHRPTSGEILLSGEQLRGSDRGRAGIQMVFQDPESSLDPRKTIRFQIEEGLLIRGMGNARERSGRVSAMLDLVGLGRDLLPKYPHELSGGQKQRVAIARSLILEPQLLLLDEPTSALDVSVQAQILNLLMEIRGTRTLTYLLITHDLKIVSCFSDRVAVMYLGRIVESGTVSDIVDSPLHPYTRALLSAVPDPGRRMTSDPVRGEIPSPLDPPGGCAFRTRCPDASDVCETPPPRVLAGGREVSCHLHSGRT